MGKIIDVNTFPLSSLKGEERLWVYNGIDCCVTEAVHDEIKNNDTKESNLSLNFVRALQAPALEMMLRGIKVDTPKKMEIVLQLEVERKRLYHILSQFAHAVWDRDLNPNSPKQLCDFFYIRMKLPPQYKYDKGRKKLSTDRNCLEKLKAYRYARPIVNVILALRDVIKKLSVLHVGVDKDGRIRTSYNICGTETGRWSSSENAFGTGTNMQNIEDKLRQILIADKGMKLAYVDLDQAESRVVAYISEDENYIYACESGDLHTTVCKMVWANLPWGEGTSDREIANRVFYRTFTYRDMAKRGGHGTNYYGKPPTIASHLKLETKIVESFQEDYFKQFPGIRKWHHDVALQVQRHGTLTTVLGRKRVFFGRLREDTTLREAIAYEPQSVVAELLNYGLWKVWNASISGKLNIQLLAQVHDAILLQYPEEQESEIIPEVLKLITTAVQVKGRTMLIPASAEVGWNWRHYHPKENTEGILKYRGADERKRKDKATSGLLDFRFS